MPDFDYQESTCAAGSAVTALPLACSPFATLGANSFIGNQAMSTASGTPVAGSCTGSGIGVYGHSTSSNGVQGSSTSSYGVYGTTASTTATVANTAAGNAGNILFGQSAGTTELSVYAKGDVSAAGSVTIGGGTAIAEYVSIDYGPVTLPAIAADTCVSHATAALTGFTPSTSDTTA